MFVFLACGDRSDYCITATKYRSCGSYLNKLCPRTCRVCTGPESEKCLNFNDKRSNCGQRARNGHCKLGNDYQIWLMKNLCPRSCCDINELY